LVSLVVVVCIAAVSLVTVVVWPTWESRHAEELLALKRDADAAYDRKQLVEAYEGYERVTKMVGDRPLSKRQLIREVDDARKALVMLEAPTRAERAQREAERRSREDRERREREAREAELARQEAQRREAERQAKAIAEAEAERQRVASQSEARRRRIKDSPKYRALIHHAASLVHHHDSRIAGEDSVYLAMSQTAGSNVSLLGVLIQQEAMLEREDLRSKVEAIESKMQRSLIAETSVIRAVYKKDAAFLEMLGLYAAVLDKRHKGARLAARHADITAAVTRDTMFDDSAPRAITAYLSGCMLMMAEIARVSGGALRRRPSSSQIYSSAVSRTRHGERGNCTPKPSFSWPL
jgi:fused signal recognition particle receptor